MISRPRQVEVPKQLLLASMLSVSITVVVSISYTVLSILALVYYYKCDVGIVDTIDGADYFFNLVYRVYIQNDDCSDGAVWEQLTRADSVFVLNILTLSASVLCCVAALVLMIMMLTEQQSPHLHLAAYVYIGVCVASQVVDLTFATHFGIDYSYLTDQLNLSTPGLGMNYERDLIRLGAFVLMTICLKGFVANFVNCVLFVVIATYVYEYRKIIQKEEHSIHKLGALNAYDQPIRRDPWQPEPQMFYRGPQINPAYVDDTLTSMPPKSPRREPTTTDFTRSESWQSPPGARPFSYLEEPKRPAVASPVRPPASPAEHAWRQDWPPAPPVPAPDYSPQAPRRLKPALKPYM